MVPESKEYSDVSIESSVKQANNQLLGKSFIE